MTVKTSELAGWIGHTLVDDHGDKIGKITDLYSDEATGEPEWIAVKTGRIGSKLNFVPLAGAEATGDELRVPYDSGMVKHAPGVDPDGRLSQEEEARLYGHYGMTYSTERSSSGLPETGGRRRPGRDTSGPTTDDAMTRSEEDRRAGEERQETGRLRKYVVIVEEGDVHRER